MKFVKTFSLVILLMLLTSIGQGQNQASDKRQDKRQIRSSLSHLGENIQVAPSAAGAVSGSSTPGRLSRWAGVSGTSYLLGDSAIFEDKFGKIGIGTVTPTSPLTVVGMIETTLGGCQHKATGVSPWFWTLRAWRGLGVFARNLVNRVLAKTPRTATLAKSKKKYNKFFLMWQFSPRLSALAGVASL